MTAAEFRTLLARLGLTQAEAARRLGWCREFVNRLAKGRIKIRPINAAYIREMFGIRLPRDSKWLASV